MASNFPKKTPTKRKGDGAASTRYGAPTTFKMEYCEQLVQHMAEGFSFYSFGAKVDTDEPTLLGWTEKFEDFARARRLGTLKRREYYERIGHMIMTGQLRRLAEEEYAKDANGNVLFKDGKPVVARRRYVQTKGDSKPWVLTMKNAFGFQDAITVNLKGGARDAADMNDEELEQELEKTNAALEQIKATKAARTSTKKRI